MYMAEKMGKEFNLNDEYLKIANFVNYLLNINVKTKGVEGIIYPSVSGAGAGLNVAIKPSIADVKIRFVGASLYHLLKKRRKAIF